MKPIYLLMLLSGVLATPAYAMTMLLRGETVVGQVKYCIYSMSSASEQRVITIKHYESCKRIVDL